MRMRAFWMLGLALILAGASVFLARNWIENQVRPQIVQVQQQPQVQLAKVVVAATPLYFGNAIRREHLREVDWPAGVVPPGSFSSIDEILGEDGERRVALRTVEINEPLLKSKVSGFGGRASLSAILAPEMRAATIRVNDVNGVAGFVLPSDHVDIMLTRDATGGNSRGNDANLITDILLQNVKVLGIDQDANEDRDKPGVVKAVTLEVTSVQAQKLTLAQRLGELSLALRHVTNAEPEEAVKTVSLRDLQVGEANLLPKPEGSEDDKPKKTVVVKKTNKKKEGLQVRIVRGTTSSSYEVQPERRPLLGSSPAPAQPLALDSNSVAAPASQPTAAPQPSVVSKAVSAPLSLLEPSDEKAAALGAAAE